MRIDTEKMIENAMILAGLGAILWAIIGGLYIEGMLRTILLIVSEALWVMSFTMIAIGYCIQFRRT